MQKKDRNFKFYETFFNAINLLPEGEREKACYEFCKYGITGELPKETNLAMFCMGVSASVQKYQNCGGNHNPKGNNQYSLGQKNKSGQVGQVGQVEQTETKTKTKTETKTKTKTETKTKTKTEKRNTKESFNLFYSSYPKQIDEYKTFTLFDTLINEKIVSFDELMEGVKRYKEYTARAGTDERFIKSPFNWLKDMSWKNNYEIKEQARNETQYTYNAFA